MTATATNISTSDSTHVRNVVVDEIIILNGSQATAQALASSGTITTAATGLARVNPAAAVTGVILQAGTYHGQTITVINVAGSTFSVTFAAAGTSNVADGTSAVISALNKKDFTWDAVSSLWYHN